MTLEEEMERNRLLFENRCSRCGGRLHRIKQNPPGPDWTDCRDYLGTVSCKCEDCHSRSKRKRMFVRGGMIPADAFIALVDEHGWPVPGLVLPKHDPPPPPTLEEIRKARAE